MSRRSYSRRRITAADDAGNIPVSEPVVILNETKKKDYRLLYRAALGGHWELAENYIFPQNAEAYTAPITGDSKTVLHIAVGTGTKNGNHFVKELVKKMTKDALEVRDNKGETALLIAAAIGNVDAAASMIGKNQKLPYIPGENRYFPIHRAAQYVQKKMVEYLLDHVPRYDDVGGPNPYEGESGFLLLKLVISAGYYDIALKLVDRHSELLSLKYLNREDSPLSLVAGKPEAFLSGTTLNIWQRWVYSYKLVQILDQHSITSATHNESVRGLGGLANRVADSVQDEQGQKMTVDIEMMGQSRLGGDDEETTILVQVGHHYDLNTEEDVEDVARVGVLGNLRWHYICTKLWEFIGKLVTPIRNIHELRLSHCQLFQLIEKFCDKIDALDHKEVEKAITQPLFLATKLGIYELVETVVMELPTAIWLTDKDKRNALQVAILNRHEKVFSLIYHMSHYRQLVTKHKDKFNNNILHLAGKLAPLDRLNLVPGPALQMQRELQWFKAVEMCVEPSYRNMKNNAGKTPWMVFVEEHKQLIKDGEKWMKETAQSCTVVASLIATVVFSAGITVPGGNDNNTGLPVFSDRKAFTIFIIATAVSLFSSIASVLMFLSILTTRYTINNFLYNLPNKLSIGLFTLFLSVTTMVIAFSATLSLVIATRKLVTLVPLLVLACLTVTMFVFSQCPLLWGMLRSTYYSRSILHRKKEIRFSDMHVH